MKSKRFLQILVSLVMLFSLVGSAQPAYASAGPAPTLDAVVIDRNLNYWDANYFGLISSGLYENWRFEFTTAHNFVVTVTKVTGDVVPMVILLDATGNELGRGTGSLTSTQPVGSYSFQVQPESGMGLYMLTLREVVAPSQASASTVVAPTSINVGDSAAVTVSLNGVPTEGYTSAEFTCTYNATLVELANVAVTDLFGLDPVMAVTTPQNGSFIVAIAGSNGRKALGSGAAFTFGVEGLQAGQTTIECVARISKGDNVLTQLPSTPASLNVIFAGETPTPTFTPTPVTEEPTATPIESPTPTPVTEEPTATPVETSTPTFTPTSVTEEPTATPVESPTPTFTSTPVTEEPTATPVESPTPTFTPTSVTEEPTATPVETLTPTATPVTSGSLTGKVNAGKPVTISLYNAEDMLVTSVTASTDGTFSLTASAGIYSVVATAEGFLSAEGAVTIVAGETSTKPEITLLAGDIVNNNVIDQFDALTIGMSYNTATPPAADLNNDGIINVLDLELLARNYRATGPLEW